MQTDKAHRRLRLLILDGTYPAGGRLTEVEAASTLDMSRTPVREALRALAADGLVRPAGRGVEVIALSGADLQEAYQVRAVLEALTAELAAARQRDGHLAPVALIALRNTADTAAEATAAGHLAEAVRHNREFHRQVAQLSGNALAMRTLDRLWDQIQVSTLTSLSSPTRPPHVAAQHDELIAAITNGEVEAAGEVARRHVLDTHRTAGQKGQ